MIDWEAINVCFALHEFSAPFNHLIPHKPSKHELCMCAFTLARAPPHTQTAVEQLVEWIHTLHFASYTIMPLTYLGMNSLINLCRPIQRRAALAERGQAKGDTYWDTSQDVVSIKEAVETKRRRGRCILRIVVFMLYSTSEPKKREIIISSKTS